MPFLGYTIRLPPGFERVSGDPTAPVAVERQHRGP